MYNFIFCSKLVQAQHIVFNYLHLLQQGEVIVDNTVWTKVEDSGGQHLKEGKVKRSKD
jgi:hypothetical protein